jgi:osmotically-inducible protein OsmY
LPVTLTPLRLGSAVCFEDRWKGKITALDIADDWEVLNVTVSAGALFAQHSAKLPVTAIKNVSETSVQIAAPAAKAFAREIPPVAAPSRTVTASTQVSRSGLRLAGAMVNRDVRYQATELLLARGFTTYRVPVAQVNFEGASLMLTAAPDTLREYFFDESILDNIKRSIVEDKSLQPEEKLRLKPLVKGGVVTLNGNVWVRTAADYVEAMAANTPGVVSVRNQITDDMNLELALGKALAGEGVNTSKVWVRARLGDVIVYGNAASPRQAEDIEITVSRVAGVRKVTSRLRAGAVA